MSNIIIAAPLAAVRRRIDLILNLRAASWAAAICLFATAPVFWLAARFLFAAVINDPFSFF